MSAETDQGFILRVHPLTDTSLVVRWLTAGHGRLATVARGARQPKSAFFGRLDLFFDAGISFQRSQRSELHALREVNVARTFPAVRADYGRLTQASYAVALVELVTEVDTPVPEIHALFGGFLAHLESAVSQARLIYALEVRLLALGGLDPVEAGRDLPREFRDLASALRDEDWTALAGLSPGAAEVRSLNQLLESQFQQNWGRLPRGRDLALAVKG
jgi:DNA repair protein RecO (recombination protein O)